MEPSARSRFESDLQALLEEASLAGTRNRRQLSCTPCRQRKLKCNRGRPCENCVKKNALQACVYPDFARRGQNKPVKVKERINRLESALLELSERGDASLGSKNGHCTQTAYPEQSEAGQRPSTDTRADTVVSGSTTKWDSILDDISEIKDYFEENNEFLKRDIDKLQIAMPSPKVWDIIYGVRHHQSLEALLSCLPERPQVDRMVAKYFEMLAFFRPVVHPKQFQREYNKFWKDPAAVSISWLGLLFAMLQLTAQVSGQLSNDASNLVLEPDAMAATFRHCALQCLTLDDYAKGDIHLLQGMLTHLESEYFQSLDPQANFYILTGTIVRVALMLKLHRDPRHFSNLSPFQAEMRRRLWLNIVHGDILLSFQMGLPSMIPYGQADTTLPRNLREDDFDEDTKVLPDSRPFDNTTNMAFYLAKAPVIKTFGHIASHLQDVHSSPEAVQALDAQLRQARANVPAYYQMRPISDSLIDPAFTLMCRFGIDQICLTGFCILHRKGLVAARFDAEFKPSRQACVEAAMAMLEYQHVRHEESKPGGRLSGLGSTMLSFTKNDWLLAAMLICLDIHLSATNPTNVSDDVSIWGRDRREEMLKALERSYYIWREYSEESVEALKASEALAAMLAKIRPEFGISTRYGSTRTTTSLNGQSDLDPTSAAPCTTQSDGGKLGPEFQVPDLFSEEPGNIDWDELDRFFISTGAMSSTVYNQESQTEDWLNGDLWASGQGY
ncbi:hypothetical protein PV08_00759 [Exophiala spinifera]|uniref:Zn(2)-C6 fungal-type domain-containing protein n=1 Tax=Exophiala spinifera TaxID=91928 RepID=A0A0D2C9C4_9EURO|nr:uncharacterized protein PV08_00759 [Exophiala spinifera]KIW20184.1 hypothetical protein PV08_00759 [Exophiala spinifera]